MQFILNIGLDSQASGQIAAHVAREIVGANDFIINSSTVLNSDTEPTLVANVTYVGYSPSLCLQSLYAIANDLDQDCLAVYREKTGRGALIGPRAAEWGTFNPEFFFLPTGERLSATLRRAA